MFQSSSHLAHHTSPTSLTKTFEFPDTPIATVVPNKKRMIFGCLRGYGLRQCAVLGYVWFQFGICHDTYVQVHRPTSKTKTGLLVLGLDPGTHTTGYGIVRRTPSRLQHIDNGLIVAPRKESLANRLVVITAQAERLMDEVQPDVVVIEAVFSHINVKSALALGHARGALLVTAARQGIEVISYPPALVKKTVAGRGRATKHQVQMMVKTLLGLPEVPAEDAADGLAMAICHCHHITGRSIRDRVVTRSSSRSKQ